MNEGFQSFTTSGKETKMESPISADNRSSFSRAESGIEEFLFHSKCPTPPCPAPPHGALPCNAMP